MHWTQTEKDLILATLRGLAWADVSNPSSRPAKSTPSTSWPAVIPAGGHEVPTVFAISRDDVGPGGTVVLRSPHCWVEWRLYEGHDNLDKQVIHQARTGPSSEAHVFVSTAMSVKAIIRRRTDISGAAPTGDPIIDPLTGLISGVGGDADAENSPESLLCYYLRGVQPHDLRRSPLTYFFGAAGAGAQPNPVDGAQFGATVHRGIGYAPYTYRSAITETNVLGGNTWEVRGPAGYLVGEVWQTTAGTEATLFPGAWNFIALNPGIALRNVSVQWTDEGST